MPLGFMVASALCAVFGIGLVARIALRHRRQVLTDRDQAVWRELFRARGGATKKFDGYDQAQAVSALKAERARFQRRYRRHKTVQGGTHDRATVTSIDSRRKVSGR